MRGCRSSIVPLAVKLLFSVLWIDSYKYWVTKNERIQLISVRLSPLENQVNTLLQHLRTMLKSLHNKDLIRINKALPLGTAWLVNFVLFFVCFSKSFSEKWEEQTFMSFPISLFPHAFNHNSLESFLVGKYYYLISELSPFFGETLQQNLTGHFIFFDVCIWSDSINQTPEIRKKIFQKKGQILSFPKMTYHIVFSSKKWCLSTNQSGIEKLKHIFPDFLAWGDCKLLLYYKFPYDKPLKI